METCKLIKSAKIALHVSRLRFPKHSPYVFLFYMLILYKQIRKFNEIFKTKAVPCELLSNIVENCTLPFCDDVHNLLVVSENYLEECGIADNFIKIVKDKTLRIAYVIGANTNANVAILSDNLKFNLEKIEEIKLRPVNPQNIIFAAEIDLSLINTHHDVSNAVIDTLIKNYFKTPKFVCKNDLIAVNFQKYAPEFFYASSKVVGLKTVYFKCNKVLDKSSKEILSCCLCIIGETTIKQSANVQSFVAPVLKNVRHFDFENCENYQSYLISRCPDGLEDYLGMLERAVKPFLKSNKLQLKPAFLLQGSKGSGQALIVSSLASKLGLHLYETTSGDVTASVYAQTETKIRNIFFKAKLCAPCILTIRNFENFGKNNEGQHDERIMSFFKAELENLFKNNSFPLILICLSNSKEVPAELSRAFLEIFDVAAPGETQRFQILQWVLNEKNLEHRANLEEIAGKTHGFLFEDLKALAFYAQKNSLKDSSNFLRVSDFDEALDLMQSKYSQSLGAPKIPKVEWSDVGGLSDVKHEIIRTINLPLRHPELLKTTGLKRSGILLYGPPGTGKTLMAKAVATECNLCFLSVKGPELLNMYVGQSEQNVREVFERAREASPCIIFFDELDSLAPNRGISGDSGGVMDRVVSQLLAEMDGLDQAATIFIIGATNRPDLIDPALLRPGRFDKLLYVGPCTDVESKVGVLRALTRKFKLGDDTSLREMVKLCPKSVTGADFYGLCSNAWMCAVKKLIEKIENEGLKDLTHENVVVTMDDFRHAVKDLKPSIKNEDLVCFETLQRQLGVAEKKRRNVYK